MEGAVGQCAVGYAHIEHHSVVNELADEAIDKLRVATDGQWRQRRIVVVPTPSLTQEVGILHAAVCHDAAADRVYAHAADTLHEGIHVVNVETRIETAHAVEIARQGVVFYLSGIIELGAKLVGAAQLVDGGDGGEKLHGRCRTQHLVLVHLI